MLKIIARRRTRTGNLQGYILSITFHTPQSIGLGKAKVLFWPGALPLS